MSQTNERTKPTCTICKTAKREIEAGRIGVYPRLSVGTLHQGDNVPAAYRWKGKETAEEDVGYVCEYHADKLRMSGFGSELTELTEDE